MEFKKAPLTEDDIRNTSHYNRRIENAKKIIDSMIASISNKIDLKEDVVLGNILRKGAMQLQDGTTVSYNDMIKDGIITGSSLTIFTNGDKTQWEINGSRDQYQIFNTEYGDKKVKTEWGSEIPETISSRSQQYNGTTVMSIDNKRLMEVMQNDISGFETIMSTVFSDNPEKYSLFFNNGENVQYKGEYDYGLIKRATLDIRGLTQMEEDGCIFSEERLNTWDRVQEGFGIIPEKKSEEEIQEALQTRASILEMCNPLLEEAQQVVSATLEKIEKENAQEQANQPSFIRRIFGKIFRSKSLEEIKQESKQLESQEQELHSQYVKSLESNKEGGLDEK